MTSRHILTEVGFSVVEARDREEALRLVWESQPDLIILDMLLPKLGGEHVLKALRQDLATTRIPVIVVSSLPQSNADKLNEAGAMAYIEKSKTRTNQERRKLSPAGKRCASQGKGRSRVQL